MSVFQFRRKAGSARRRASRRIQQRLIGLESLEGRALLAQMDFTIQDNSGLNPSEYAIYAMGSNFTSASDTNYYMNDSFTFVKGAPPNNQTPSYKVGASTKINVPDNADLAGMRLYFFVVPVGGVASATVTDASYGYQSQTGTIPVTFSQAPDGGETAQGYAQLIATSDPTLDVNKVGSIVITNPGRGYTTAPTITIPPPGAVDTVTLVRGGAGYNAGTTNFAISGGSGGGQAIITGGSVTSVSLISRGGGYTTVVSPQSPTISPGNGFEVDVTLVRAATATSTLFGSAGPSLPMGTEPTNPPNFPFITGIVEFTVTAAANTVDLQTVDGFTLPMTITAGKLNVNVTGKQYGQPVAPPSSAVVTRAAIFEAYSRFMTSKGAAGAPYLDLVYDLPNGLVVDGQKGGILSPDLYLSAADSSTGDFENLTSPLDDVFTNQLTTLFSSAISVTNPLNVQGVPSGSIAAQTYTVTYNGNVDYPRTESGTNGKIVHGALQFTGSDKNEDGTAKNTFSIFSPIELTALEDHAGNPLTGTITAVAPAASPTTATLTLANAVPDYVQPGWFVIGNGLFQGTGTNQSQAITPWYVNSVSTDRKTVSLALTSVNGPVSGKATTTTTASQYRFGKLPYISMMLTPGQMAFGNSGVFADSALQYINKSPEQTVLGNLEYQVVAAMNRGVLFATGAQNPKKVGGTSEVWGTEAGWYPLDVQPQNLFSLFMHVGQVDGTPIFFQPENPVRIQGATGPLMGAAYGFPFDENPAATTAVPTPTQVPSKFDGNIGGGASPLPTDIVVTFGAWGTINGPTVTAPAMFTVLENSQNNPFQWPASPVPFTDTGATSLTVTLSASGGTIAVNSQAAQKLGLTVGPSAQGPTISGAITALNTFFQTQGNVTYTPIPGSLATQTLATTAVDPQNKIAHATSKIDIVSAAAPVVTAPAVFTVNENTATSLVWPASPAPFADTNSQTLTVTLTVTGGVVAFNGPTAAAAGLTVGGAPAAPSIAGPVVALNRYFQTAGNVTYTPITGSLVGQTLTTSASDGSERGQATSAIKIIAPTPPTPGVPTVTLTPGEFMTAVSTPVGLLFTGIPFADTGATPTTVFTVAMSTGGTANGTLAASTGSGVTAVTSGVGATFTGTLSALNTYFNTAPAKITYSPPANVQGTRTLSTVIAVNGKTSSPAGTTIVIGTNVAPTVAAPIAFSVPEQGRMNLVWPRGITPFSDRDSRLLTVTLSTDSPASVGSFAASPADRNVKVVTTGDVVQLTGRQADLNRYFATAGRITYSAIGPSLQPRVLTVRASDGGGVGTATSAILVRARGPVGVPAINRSASLGSTPAGTPLVITYAQLVTATNATTANSRSVEFLLGGVSSGRLELWDGAKWVRVPATLPKFKEPILAPGGQIRWTPPARATGQRAAFSVLAWDGWRMSAPSQAFVNVTG